MSEDPTMPLFQLAYQTVEERPRTGPFARVLGFVGVHPVLSGFVVGICVVLIAMASAFEGVKKAPMEALAISAVVVVVWTVLIGLMGGFFARQGMAQVTVRRDIKADPDEFRWLQDGELLISIRTPSYEIFAVPTEEELSTDTDMDEPWPVWLLVTGDGGQFILQSKRSKKKALQYDEVSPDVLAEVREKLPAAIASRLLNYAESRADDSAE